jgi:anti-sigma regulatory factor (Ser/Thr protein kinase)
MVEQELRLSLNRTFEAPAYARRALSSVEDAVDGRLLDDVRLLVSELVTNSVLHSATGSDGPIDLCLWVSSDEVRCEVSDIGSWRDPVPDPRGLSGWGFQLVDRLSDRWGVIRNDETTVWFEIER